MNLRTCASLRASFRTLRSRSSVCCSMALRALSSGPTTAINSGRSSISSSARRAKTLNLARPITRPTFLRRPRIWFSRSRLIFTSNARLTSNALTIMIVEILDANLLEPAGLHDAGDTGRIVAVTLIEEANAPEIIDHPVRLLGLGDGVDAFGVDVRAFGELLASAQHVAERHDRFKISGI